VGTGNPVLYVCSTGGHLDELVRLAPRLTPAAAAEEWVTFDSVQSRRKLAGRTTHFIPPIDPKDLGAAARALPRAYRLLRRHHYARVVSTGAAVAVPFSLAARARGVGVHYIESCARRRGPSLTGRIIAGLPGVRVYTQHEGWAGSRWQYRGSVLDGYAPDSLAMLAGRTSLKRVLVTFGTQRGFPFRRAAERLARLLPQVTAPDAEVLWQTGFTYVADLGIDGVALLPPDDLAAAAAEADVVIAHAGLGSALLALDAGRCPLLLPRRLHRGEHTDDHQTQLADDLDRRGLAVARDPDRLTAEDLLHAASLRATPLATPALVRLQGA
jgi:UDP-N-acetylglucosamine--N-acetylmuramyl-(pentapeptide) pyrophosphoryl-undecaprenol N-acetylglucosamine transferase